PPTMFPPRGCTFYGAVPGTTAPVGSRPPSARPSPPYRVGRENRRAHQGGSSLIRTAAPPTRTSTDRPDRRTVRCGYWTHRDSYGVHEAAGPASRHPDIEFHRP